MKNIKLNSKGVAGLDLVLSVITMLFVIGLLVMIYALMGGALQTASYTTTTRNVVNETYTPSGSGTIGGAYRSATCGTITAVKNSTGAIAITSGNYTQTGCSLVNLTSEYVTQWKVSYPVTYEADNTATNLMNDTVDAIADTPDWFPIVIVITFMVVLILLTVMIVRAVRGSGLMGGEIGA